MSILARVRSLHDRFEAYLPADPTIRAEGTTRQEAIQTLRAEVARRYATGELVDLELRTPPSSCEVVGILGHDPTLEELIAEIYRQRDAQPCPGEE